MASLQEVLWEKACPNCVLDQCLTARFGCDERTRLRLLKDTLLSKGAWQQVTRIEDLCHAQVSHKW